MELITGNDPNIQYVDTVGTGGYGTVYKVAPAFGRKHSELVSR